MPRTFYTNKTVRDPMDTTPPKPSRRELPLEFSASGSEYFRIWIVNLLLTIVTLSLYLPFAKARRLRYFYANTLVDGQPLAFHGNPWTMFRGHLVVMAFGLVYFFSAKLWPAVGAALFLIFLAVWPALWRSSLIFRLRNTSWRGLRFDFTGGLGGAYKAFMPWLVPVLGVFLFAILAAAAAPHMKSGAPPTALFLSLIFGFYAVLLVAGALTWVWIKRYQHGGYAIAGQQASLKLSLGQVLMLGLKAIGLSIFALLALGVLAAGVAWAIGSFEGGSARAGAVGAVVGVLAFYAATLFAWGPYLGARLQNLLWTGTRSQQLVFLSRLSARSLGWLTLKNWLLIILTLGLYRPFAVVATTRLKLDAVRIGLYGDLDHWLSERARNQENAVGEMGGDFFGFDVGL